MIEFITQKYRKNKALSTQKYTVYYTALITQKYTKK